MSFIHLIHNFNQGFEQCDILEFACCQGDSHINIVKYLITNQICTLTQYGEGYRSLLYAIQSNSVELLHYLIQNGAKIGGFQIQTKNCKQYILQVFTVHC